MIYRRLVRPALFRLDPESAHEAATHALETAGRLPLVRKGLQLLFDAPERPRTVAGLTLRNPVGLAAGFDKACRLVGILPSLGFGFAEVGTITLKPQDGRPKPRLFRLPENGALLNRMGFNNPGAEEAALRLERQRPYAIPIGVNVGKQATTALDDAPAEYRKVLEILWDAGDFFVLNISSPNTDELRRLHEPARLDRLLGESQAAGKGRAAKPVFVKLSPDLGERELSDAAAACRKAGVGVVATNTTTSRVGLDARWASEAGGVSGRPIKARATDMVRRLRELLGTKVPLIGVGGVFDGEDAKEKLSAGADLVEVYTGWVYEGPAMVRRIVEAL